MGYQTRAKRFSFMGVDSTPRGYDVVQEQDDFPVLADRRAFVSASEGETISMSRAEFVTDLLADSPRCWLNIVRG